MGVFAPFSSWRDDMVRFTLFFIMVVVFVVVSYITILVIDVVPYPNVIWASPALNIFIGTIPLPMLYV